MGVEGLVTIHINNTPRSGRHGQFLIGQGMLKGAPDLVHCIQSVAIFHELKAKKGRIKPEQIEVHERLRRTGFEVLVSYGFDEAVKHLADKGLIRGGLSVDDRKGS